MARDAFAGGDSAGASPVSTMVLASPPSIVIIQLAASALNNPNGGLRPKLSGTGNGNGVSRHLASGPTAARDGSRHCYDGVQRKKTKVGGCSGTRLPGHRSGVTACRPPATHRGAAAGLLRVLVAVACRCRVCATGVFLLRQLSWPVVVQDASDSMIRRSGSQDAAAPQCAWLVGEKLSDEPAMVCISGYSA